MTVHEPRCVQMKRRGAELVAKQLEGKSVQEQLEFWRLRTGALKVKQATAHSHKQRG